jgi:high-affinity nickel-transport protein
MIGPAAFTVFALGLRHGADPDHLAAIDNVTRNAYVRTPRLSRLVGTFFAGGHSVMVLAISALIGLLGARVVKAGSLIETIGTGISIVVLLLVAAANVHTLLRGGDAPTGLRTRLLPRAWRDSTNALLAIPIGLLFGFGFETSSQIAAYAVVFGADAGLFGAILVGATFSAGMVVTDTLDSLLVHGLVAHGGARIPAVMRLWIGAVTALAVLVALYETAQLAGWHSPFGDLTLSMVLVAALLVVFGVVVVRTRTLRDAP